VHQRDDRRAMQLTAPLARTVGLWTQHRIKLANLPCAKLCAVRAYACLPFTNTLVPRYSGDVPVLRAQHAADQISGLQGARGNNGSAQRERCAGRITDSRARGRHRGGDSFEVTAAGASISPSLGGRRSRHVRRRLNNPGRLAASDGSRSRGMCCWIDGSIRTMPPRKQRRCPRVSART
jgi:hypothetical protein